MTGNSAAERNDPWHQATSERLQEELDRELIEGEPEDRPGRIYAAADGASLRSVLTALAAPELLEAEYGDDAWWYNDIPSTVLARIPEADVRDVVLCWVSDSMASGQWSLNELRVGDRGYVFHIPDYGIGGPEEQPLLGGWEPVDDVETRRECLLGIYEREWRNHAYPPVFGQWAVGDSDILLAGIERALDGTPQAWGWVFDRLDRHLKRVNGLRRDDIAAAARLVDLSPRRVREAVEDYLVEMLLTGGQLVGGMDFTGATPTAKDEKRALIGLLVHCVGLKEP